MRVCKSYSHVKARTILLAWLAFAVITPATEAFLSPRPSSEAEPYLNLGLRHIFHHGTYQDPRLHRRLDVTSDVDLWTSTGQNDRPARQIPVRFQSLNIHRLADRNLSKIESYLSLARETGEAATLDASYWTTDEVFAPNISDQRTVVSLAKAAYDAYVETRDDAEWEDLPIGWNASIGFGWQGDGLRGYIFADPGNSTVLVALKGTSVAVFDGEGTTTQDKLNDNLFFSCCCAQGGRYFWKQACDCYSTTYTCNQTCLRKALKDEHRYYRAAIELYSNVTMLYPGSNVWLTGHSLGGSVSSLLGLTFGVPTVTFEAPGEALAASRLGLPNPPDFDRPAARRQTAGFHFGHTADPVFMGSCNGLTASCTLGGYAMESQCHTGMQCIYDTVTDFHWRVGIGYHQIKTVIDSVLLKYDKPPRCEPDDECVDCFNWKYFESNESTPSTTSSATSTRTTTRTRTATCRTPGWWGCLDKTTNMATTSTSSSSTSTCRTPGWFGCNDPTATTFSIQPGHTIAHTPMSTSTQAPSMVSSTTSSHSTSCETPGWFWGCYDKTSTTSTALMTSTTLATHVPSQTLQTPARVTCAHSRLFGWFCDRWVTQTVNVPPATTFGHPTATSWRDEM